MSIPPHSTSDVDTSPAGQRLESWKEIAVYLNRSVRTLHRWEKEEGLPVHRQLHKELGSVFAYTSELDAWSRARSVHTEDRENEREPGLPNRSRMVVAIALSGAVVLIGSISYLVARGFRQERAGQDAYLAGLELISTFSGSHRWPSLSPDGRRLAFVSDAGGTPQVWIKNLASGDPVQLTFGDVPASRPQWSPQGDRIVYSTVGNGIWSAPSLGGEPRQIIKDGRNADLSRDGRRLVFERAGEIFIAGADGSGTRMLPRRPRSVNPYYGDTWPTFSPDGESIALFVAEEGRYGDYWILPSNGDAPRRVTADFQEGGAPAWTPDGKSLLIRSSRAGSMNLWRVSVVDGTLERLTSGAGDDFDPAISPDGRTVLFANVKRTWEVIVQDLHSGTRRTVLARRTLLVLPRFSPDGRRIALAGRNSRGETHLFVMDADGSNLRGSHGRSRRAQHHAAVGWRWRHVVLLSGTTYPDISESFGLGWCIAGDCAVVFRAPISGGGGSSRSHGRLFVRRTRGSCSSRVYAISRTGSEIRPSVRVVRAAIFSRRSIDRRRIPRPRACHLRGEWSLPAPHTEGRPWSDSAGVVWRQHASLFSAAHEQTRVG